MFDFWKKRKRAELRETPLSEEAWHIIDHNVPYVQGLSEEDRKELSGLVQAFLDEKTFEGCGGQLVDDEIRLTIAAQACVLLLHRKNDLYPELETILVYPSAYRSVGRRREGDVVLENDEVRLGESWAQGSVVLAWDHAARGAKLMGDGENVVLHEFAHQLDAESGDVDGAPKLDTRARYEAWAKVLGREYEALVDEIHSGKRTNLDAYAGTSPAEFFAVVTEMFFERPEQLRRHHPALYEQLQQFYLQDPAEVKRRSQDRAHKKP